MSSIKENHNEQKPLTFLDYKRAISIVENRIRDYEEIDKRLFADKEFVLFFYMEADWQDPWFGFPKTPILKYDEAKELRKDKEVITEALKVHPATVEYINLDDLTRDMILPALKKNLCFLTRITDKASKLIRKKFANDKELVMELFNHAEANNINLDDFDKVILRFEEFAELRKDEEVVRKSLKLQPCSVIDIDKKFAEDEELILPALKRYPYLLGIHRDSEFRQAVVDNKELLLKLIRDPEVEFENQYLETSDKNFYDIEVLIATLAQYDDSYRLSSQMSYVYRYPYDNSDYKMPISYFETIKTLVKKIEVILDENKELGNPRKLSEEEILKLYEDIKSIEFSKHAISLDNLSNNHRVGGRKKDGDYLQEKTDSVALRSNGIISQPDLDVDSSLSKIFYEFLNAKSNDVPNNDYIKKIIDEAKDEYVSVGYGITVTYDDGIKLTCVRPMEDGTERLDVITSDDYKALKMTNSGYRKVNLEKEKNRIFNPKRVEIVQERLGVYEMINSSKGKARIKK